MLKIHAGIGRRSRLLALAALTALSVQQAAAASLDAMQGAWTMEGIECAQTFRSENGKLVFVDRGATTNVGIIISGSKISAPMQTCTVTRIRDHGDRLTASLSCSDAILFSEMSVSFRMKGPDRFERFDPEFDDMLAVYRRCEPGGQ